MDIKHKLINQLSSFCQEKEICNNKGDTKSCHNCKEFLISLSEFSNLLNKANKLNCKEK